MEIIEKRLDNGLNLIICKKSGLNFIYCNIILDIGSTSDPIGKEGLVHLMEHYLMSSKSDGVSISEYYSNQDSFIEASTDRDNITLSLTLNPSKYLEILKKTLDLLLINLFDVEIYKKEKKIVLNEIDEDNDDSYENTLNGFYEYVLGKVGYSVLGTKTSVRRIQSNDLREILTKIRPSLIRILVLGNMDIIELSDEFNNFYKDYLNKNDFIKFPIKRDFLCYGQEQNGQGNFFGLIKIPKNDFYSTVYFMFVFAYLFGDGTDLNTVLVKKVREELNLVYSLGGIVKFHWFKPYFVFYFGCKTRHLDCIIEEIEREIRVFFMNGFNKAELENIVKKVALYYKREFDTPFGVLENIGFFGTNAMKLLTLSDKLKEFKSKQSEWLDQVEFKSFTKIVVNV